MLDKSHQSFCIHSKMGKVQLFLTHGGIKVSTGRRDPSDYTESEQTVIDRGKYLGVSKSKSVTSEDWFCLHCDIKGIFQLLGFWRFPAIKSSYGNI